VTGRRVLIAGANPRISTAIAEEFRSLGGRVAGIDLHDGSAASYEHFEVADCSESAAARRAVDAAATALGGLDTLVLATASMPVASATATTDEQWRSALSATLDAAFFVTRAALAHLEAGASIVAVSSTNAHLAAPGLPAYSAAKAGLEGLMRQIALEYGPRGIRANTVCPGTVNDAYYDAEGYPLGRIGRPEELAKAVRFLGGDESSFVTGATLIVDGGLSISSPTAWLRQDLRDRWL
jgi:NAD(P)-dependent dehydrogenase (short-subunit alcohol dehydrogenase family)